MEGMVSEMARFWKNRNVFLTGITGFLGSHLAKELVRRGAFVSGLIRDSIPLSYLYEGAEYQKIKLVPGALEDRALIERALGEYEIDTVFHTAAQAIVGVANRNPISTFEANIKGTWNVLEACRRSPLVKRLVVASSDKAYGEQKTLPYDEDMPLQGRHPYDVSKSCTDLLSQAYYQSYQLPVCITRCGNLFGEGDLNFNRIIPQTIRSVLNGERPMIRSDGTLIRDYFYVEDAVSAYLLLAEKLEEQNLAGEAFNFSNEVQYSVKDLVDELLVLMNSELKPIILNEATNEINHQYLCANKARRVLGWKPTYTIKEGLRRTIDWYTKFLLEAADEAL